jgi:hypothetical protein
MTSASVLVIWSPESTRSVRNLEYGLETRTWGFPRNDPAYHQAFDYVLFGHHHSGRGGPRQQPGPWEQGTVSVILGRRTGATYEGHAPHWPNELEEDAILYPVRFGFAPIASRDAVTLTARGPLGAVGSDALRRAGILNRGILVRLDLSDLITLLGVSLTPAREPDLSLTPGAVDPTVARVAAHGDRAGRSSDSALTLAVEQRAVNLATRHMRDEHGWTVTPLGKPYDLDCVKPDGTVKHVEVKGTTGGGGQVEYTPNEVKHFRECPHGADLIVVRDIHVDRTTTPYRATGGVLLHIPDYRAPAADLQATGWLGRVDGW